MGLVNQANAPMPTSDTMPMPEEEAPQEVDGLQERAMQEPATAEQDDLTPEEREAYESAMKMASEMLHKSDESFEAIMSQLSSGDITETAPEVLSFIIEQIEVTFKGELPEGIILPLVDEISDLVLELIDAGGLQKINEEIAKAVKTNSVQAIIDDYGATQEQVQGAMQGVSEDELANIQQMFGGQ